MTEKPPRPRRPLSGTRAGAGLPGSGGATAAGPSSQRSGTTAASGSAPMYRPLRYLGRGTFGVVLLAEEVHSGERVAIKRVRYDPRLHNREVAILNTVLVDEPHPAVPAPAPPSPLPAATGSSGGGVGSWAGAHHPNIVELLDSYVTYDSASSEAEEAIAAAAGMSGGGALGGDFGFLPPFHPTQTRYPLHGDHGPAASAAAAVRYLEMVMSYLPMDLSHVKKFYFKAHRMPSMYAASTPVSPPASPTQPPTSAAGSTDASAGVQSEVHGRRASGRPPASPKVGSGVGQDPLVDSPHQPYLPLRWVKVVLFQLARALTFMHARHVCHRDLKPANVLVDPDTGRLQVCDFGSAKQIVCPSAEKNVSYICSRYYRAPELLFGALHYGCAVDMWSFGCLAAELLRESGRPLFRGSTSVDQMAELFKVLGAPSRQEMYAMNPQCAEALLRTHAMHHHAHRHPQPPAPGAPHHAYPASAGSGGVRQARGAASTGLHVSGARVEVGGEEEEDYLHDALEDGAPSQTSATPSTTPSKPVGAGRFQHHEHEYPATHHGSGDVPAFEEYYDVLKVRAIPWRHLFPVGTPNDAVSLIAALLCYTPEKRLTAPEVVEHSFFDELFAAADAADADAPEGAVKVDAASLRLPSGRLMPLAMFQITELERTLYTDKFLARMARQAELVAAAAKRESRS